MPSHQPTLKAAKWRQLFEGMLPQWSEDPDPHMAALGHELKEVDKVTPFTRRALEEYLQHLREELNSIGDYPDRVLDETPEALFDASPRGFVLRYLRLSRQKTSRRDERMVRADLKAAVNAVRKRSFQIETQSK